jgi:hypothetical protein
VRYEQLANLDALRLGGEHERGVPVGVAGEASVFMAGVYKEGLLSLYERCFCA